MVIGVSPDSPAALQRFRAKHNLPFFLLSDPDHEVAQRYGVWKEKKARGKTYFGIVRSHFVIDETGQVLDAQVEISPKDSVKKAVESLMAAEPTET